MKSMKIVKNDDGVKYIVKVTNKEINSFLDLLKSTTRDAFYQIKEGEKILDSDKKQFLKNYNEKNLVEVNPKVEKYQIESVFKEFQIDVKVGGQCTSKQCSLMISACFTLFKLKFDDKFIFAITLLPYLDCAISIIPSVNSEICIGFGPIFNIKNSSENSFDIDISGGASVSVTVDFGIFFPSVQSPIRLSFNIGLVGILGSGKVGVKLSLFYKGKKFNVDLYTEFKAFELSFYVMFMLSFSLEFGVFKFEFGFSFYIFQKTFGGFKYEYHYITTHEYKKSKLIDEKVKIIRKKKGYSGAIKPSKDKFL